MNHSTSASTTLRVLVVAAAVAVFAGRPGVTAERPGLLWVADTEHSSIEFRTRHWGIVDIIGWFEDFDVTVYSDSVDFTDAVVEARVRPQSARMPNPEMARNMIAMFDTAAHPEVVFRSTGVEAVGANAYKLTGELTMNGVTNEVEWRAQFNGFGLIPHGMPGYTVKGVINRLDFTVDIPDSLKDDGPPLIGERVFVTVNLRLIHP